MPADRIIQESPTLVSGVVHGPLPNKSNRRRLVFNRRTHRPAFIKARDAVLWVERVHDLVASSSMRYLPLDADKTTRLYLCARVYPADMRRDLDMELVPDALQSAGVIHNDRHIWIKVVRRMEPDPENPRVEFRIGSYASADKTRKGKAKHRDKHAGQ
jgi:Holliday junction resolvase RusA-like endonuclease